MERLIAVDPGVSKDHAFALFEDGVLADLRMGRVSPWDAESILIESQQVYKVDGVKRARDLIDLAHASGEVAGDFLARFDGSVTYVMPRGWKGSVPKPHTKKGYVARGYAIEYRVRKFITLAEESILDQAQKEYGKQWQKNLDLVDAVGIGLWRLRRWA